MDAADPYNLQRFVAAQEAGGIYERALAELRDGVKRSHWMWFVFPQLAGLGRSATSRHYAITGLAEAENYLRHPVLGPRLIECSAVVAGLPGHSAQHVFGSVDAIKLHSSMTLFHRADPARPVFRQVLAKYFSGRPDHTTDDLLGSIER